MKKSVLCAILSLSMMLTAFAQESNVASAQSSLSIDTLYYNSEWKVVSSKIIADYYRVKINSENEIDRQYRDYFITGELQAKGGYVSIDNIDDDNTVYHGKCIDYYKNGEVAEERTYINGELNGEWIVYNENGLIRSHANFKNDKMDGIYTEFNDEGVCFQFLYNNGKVDDFYTASNSSGCVMKLDTHTHEPIWESPQVDEMEKSYRDGVAWSYYNKNGVVISMSNSLVKDYGKYYKLTFVIANNSLVPIDLDPAEAIKAVTVNKKHETMGVRVLSSEEYIKKVKRAQNWQTALVGISEGLAASNAGYSTSTTATSTYSRGSVHANDKHRSVHGSYSSSSRTVSTTTQYDAAAAYQAQVIASNRVAEFESSMLNERHIKEEGYLKRTTIEPTEVISGYVNIDRYNQDKSVCVVVNINGAEYVFNFSN